MNKTFLEIMRLARPVCFCVAFGLDETPALRLRLIFVRIGSAVLIIYSLELRSVFVRNGKNKALRAGRGVVCGVDKLALCIVGVDIPRVSAAACRDALLTSFAMSQSLSRSRSHEKDTGHVCT